MTTNTQLELAKKLLSTSDGSLDDAIQALRIAQHGKPRQSGPPKNSEVVASIQNVTKKYKVGKHPVQALAGVSLDIFRGEFVALAGSSGSGKSTLLQLIGGLDKPDEGIISIAGQNLAGLSDRKLARFRNRTIGFVFQFFYLQPFLNVATNIEVPAMFAHANATESKGRARTLGETVGLGERQEHLPAELSGGQMQRAAIARALQNQPSILLADEPTGNLDSAMGNEIMEILMHLNQTEGTTIVMVTHDENMAKNTHRLVRLFDGTQVQ